MPKSHAAATSAGRTHVRVDKRQSAISGHINKPASSEIAVVRDAITGRFVVGGTDERRLINQHSSVSVKPAPGKPKYFTQTEIENLTKLMKVA